MTITELINELVSYLAVKGDIEVLTSNGKDFKLDYYWNEQFPNKTLVINDNN